MPTKLQGLEDRVRRIKAELNRLGELRPGVLSEQYNVCGKAGCRCKATPPKKHGPYYQLSWSRNRKSTTRFVRRQELRAVRGQIKAYQRLQQLVEEWIAASVEICEINRQKTREE
jgi:Family of unknown function (DUF6788)